MHVSGRLLDAVRIVPPLLWRHLGEQFGVTAPDLASLRAMCRHAPTLIEHQQQACETLGFRWLTEHQRRALVSALRGEFVCTDDRQRLLGFARRWLYEHRLLIVHERRLRTLISDLLARRGKAWSSSGCKSHLATFAPASSSRSNRGGTAIGASPLMQKGHTR